MSPASLTGDLLDKSRAGWLATLFLRALPHARDSVEAMAAAEYALSICPDPDGSFEAAFGLVGDIWHGAKPPSKDWVEIERGARGGRRWRRKHGGEIAAEAAAQQGARTPVATPAAAPAASPASGPLKEPAPDASFEEWAKFYDAQERADAARRSGAAAPAAAPTAERPPAQPQTPPLLGPDGKPVGSSSSQQAEDDAIVGAIYDLSSDAVQGASVFMYDLLGATKFPSKGAFDAAVLRLAEQGKVAVGRIDHPLIFTPEELSKMVRDPETGQYYNTIHFRTSAVPPRPSKKAGAQFGMVGDEWHGPEPPGEGWVEIKAGPRGGKRWKKGAGGKARDDAGTQQRGFAPMTRRFQKGTAEQPKDEGLTNEGGTVKEKFTPSAGPPSLPKQPEGLAPEQVRAGLKSSPVKERRPTGSETANKSEFLVLEGGLVGVFKPSSGECKEYTDKRGVTRPLRYGVEGGTFYRREVAAYQVALLLGMGDLVPVTTFREDAGGAGSIQHFVEGAAEAIDVPMTQMYDGPDDAARAAAFDYLVCNLDRHEAGNWLVKGDGKLVLTDNGTSFPTQYVRDDARDDFFNTRFWQHAIRNTLLVPDTSSWAERWPELEDRLRACNLEDEAVALTKQRFDALAAHSGKPIATLPSLLEGYNSLAEMFGYVPPPMMAKDASPIPPLPSGYSEAQRAVEAEGE